MKSKSTSKDWIYSIFFLSGASALIYETVWLRILTRVLGNTVYATSIILAVFMAGLALGSFAVDGLARKGRSLLRLYSYLELGIGLSAVGLLLIFQHLIPLYSFIYHLSGDSRQILTLSQSLILFILLLVPTFLMGGTLPLLTSHARRYERSFAGRIGYLYGLNTLGAVAGVVGSGLILIGLIGEQKTILLGAAFNLFAAGIAYSLSGEEKAGTAADTAISPYGEPVKKTVLAAYALSGFTALAYEVVWVRLFHIYIGNSIYTFCLTLAFYLIGLGAGSIWGARALGRTKDPLQWFGLAQFCVALYGVVGLYQLAYLAHPLSNSLNLGDMLAVPLVIVTPITFLFGAIFPLISKSYVGSEAEVVSSVGLLYALNTAGCILGSLFCGFIFMAWFGTRGTVLLLAVLNIFIGLMFLARGRMKRALAAGLILTTLILGFFSPDPFLHIVREKMKLVMKDFNVHETEFFYHKEGSAATTTAFGLKGIPRAKFLWINGKMMTALCTETKLMAHLPLLLHPHPQKMLIICFGMGTTLRSARAHRDLKCDAVELIPQVYDCFKYFHSDGPRILADPGVRHFVDDGRNFLQMRPDKYDVISIDPSPPLFSAGTVNLYSRDFMALCRQRLDPGGVMCLWIPPAEYSEVRMIMRTFQSVFPNTYVWRGPEYPGFYMIGLGDRAALNLERFDAEDKNQAILADLNEWGRFSGVSRLKQLLAASPEELSSFLEGVPAVTDDMPYTEFPLWRSVFGGSYQYTLDAGGLMSLIKMPENGPGLTK